MLKNDIKKFVSDKKNARRCDICPARKPIDKVNLNMLPCNQYMCLVKMYANKEQKVEQTITVEATHAQYDETSTIVIGKTYGFYKVLIDLWNIDSEDAIQMFKVKCTKCGKEYEMSEKQLIAARYTFLTDNPTGCKSCGRIGKKRKYSTKRVDIDMSNTEPNKNNLSTGIKHYSIAKYTTKEGEFWQHIVEIQINKVKYIIARKFLEYNTLDDECVEVANHANSLLKESKKAFLAIYGDGKCITHKINAQ